jgi:hypothetical protein
MLLFHLFWLEILHSLACLPVEGWGALNAWNNDPPRLVATRSKSVSG